MPGTIEYTLKARSTLSKKRLVSQKRVFNSFLKEPRRYSQFPLFTIDLSSTGHISPDGLVTLLEMAEEAEKRSVILQLVNVWQIPYLQCANAIDQQDVRLPAIPSVEIYTTRTIDDITKWMKRCRSNAGSIGLNQRGVKEVMQLYAAKHKKNHGPYEKIKKRDEMLRRRYESQIGQVQRKVYQNADNPDTIIDHMAWEFGNPTGIISTDDIRRGIGGASLELYRRDLRNDTQRRYIPHREYEVMYMDWPQDRSYGYVWGKGKKVRAFLHKSVLQGTNITRLTDKSGFLFEAELQERGYRVTKVRFK